MGVLFLQNEKPWLEMAVDCQFGVSGYIRLEAKQLLQ